MSSETTASCRLPTIVVYLCGLTTWVSPPVVMASVGIPIETEKTTAQSWALLGPTRSLVISMRSTNRDCQSSTIMSTTRGRRTASSQTLPGQGLTWWAHWRMSRVQSIRRGEIKLRLKMLTGLSTTSSQSLRKTFSFHLGVSTIHCVPMQL